MVSDRRTGTAIRHRLLTAALAQKKPYGRRVHEQKLIAVRATQQARHGRHRHATTEQASLIEQLQLRRVRRLLAASLSSPLDFPGGRAAQDYGRSAVLVAKLVFEGLQGEEVVAVAAVVEAVVKAVGGR